MVDQIWWRVAALIAHTENFLNTSWVSIADYMEPKTGLSLPRSGHAYPLLRLEYRGRRRRRKSSAGTAGHAWEGERARSRLRFEGNREGGVRGKGITINLSSEDEIT